jgi:hypothetical protein
MPLCNVDVDLSSLPITLGGTKDALCDYSTVFVCEGERVEGVLSGQDIESDDARGTCLFSSGRSCIRL